ncbi:HAD family hydrolase [Ancrocorticia populi]|uniref:HAD family hydrolase n=1 Tax=Ancrocorticia populi TaxID=2175228 RepID=UPI0023547ADA|nr:HAD hydrolase-like protein [Ancrocorticia populi]
MKPVLFDFDGTLADSAPVITDSYIHTLRQEQGRDYPPEFFRQFIGPPLEDSFAAMGADDVHRYVRTYRAHYREHMYETLLFPGIKQMVATLAQAGVPMAIATSKRTDYASMLADRLGVGQYMKVVCGSYDGDPRAQKQHRVEDALSELSRQGYDTAGAIMVGDRIHDLEGANANGIATILVAWGAGGPDEWSLAWRVAHSVDELEDMLLDEVGVRRRR